MAGGDEVVEVARELRRLWELRWDEPDTFGDFSGQQRLTRLLDLSGGRHDVERLRSEIQGIVDAVAKEEEEREPEYGRSMAYAWVPLLKLEERWEGAQLKTRQLHVMEKWRTEAGKRFKSHQSFAQRFELGIYEELARRLLKQYADAPTPRRRPDDRKSRPTPPSWPGYRHDPKPGQDVVILIAANAKRRGPGSGLVKLVREFERYWRAIGAFIYSLEGAHREIWRAGLLHDYEDFVELPAGFYGGLVHATEAVVAAAESSPQHTCHVVYLVDPHDNSSLYPATSSIKRQCILNQTPFLTTYQGAARWFRLDWARCAAEGTGKEAATLLLAEPDGGFGEEADLGEPRETLALAAHDRHKRTIMDLSETYGDLLTERFSERWATQVTGHLLNGGSILEPGYKNDILYDVNEEARDEVERRIEDKSEAWRNARESGPGTPGWVSQLTRGRQGGVIQLARKVLDDECGTVVFLEDAETPGDQDMELQVLDRSAQLADGNCLLLYDERSVKRWAHNLALCSGPEAGTSSMTLHEAYRRVFEVELVLSEADPRPSPKGKKRRRAAADPDRTWQQITTAAATYLLGALLTARSNKESGDPVRLGFPWGGVIEDVIGELPQVGSRSALMGAIGLRQFVDEAGTGKDVSLFKARDHAIAAGKWPPLSDPHRPPFGPDQLRVVPTVGVIGAEERSRESQSLAGRAAEVLGGKPVLYPQPAFALTSGEGNPLDDRPIEEWDELDVLLITAAPLQDRPENGRPGLATGLPADLARAYENCLCAVGTAYLQKDTRNGGVCERTHGSYAQMGISIEEIEGLNNGGTEVILINGNKSETSRVPAAWAALKAGVVSTFVTDEDFAWEVLVEELADARPLR